MGTFYWILIIATASGFLASRAAAKPWSYVDAVSGTSEPAAAALAAGLARSLKSQRIKVIFLNLARCEPHLAGASSWCANLQTSLESHLVQHGLCFLPESSKDDIRGKIAAEQVYQHNSQQVDVARAVALGEQQAFGAFVTVTVIGDGLGHVKLAANSLDIRAGVVSVSEDATMSVKYEGFRPWDTVVMDSAWIGGGLLLAAGGAYAAQVERDRANSYYASYSKATTASQATASRKKVKEADLMSSVYLGVSFIGLFGAAYGAYDVATSQETMVAYRIADAGSHASAAAASAWRLAPVVFSGAIGLNLSWAW